MLVNGDGDSNAFKIWFGDDEDMSWLQVRKFNTKDLMEALALSPKCVGLYLVCSWEQK